MRRLRAVLAALLAAGAVAAAAPTVAADHRLTALSDHLAAVLNLPWPDALPPLPTTTRVQPHPVANCRQASIRCVENAVDRLASMRSSLGCDHRAVFATTYLILTQVLLDTMRRDPHFFDDNAWLESVDAEFVNFYQRSFDDFEAGRRVPEAWRIAYDAARSGQVNAGQDLLLGINAHVQRDMPFVEAEMGLREPDGTSRKPDHDRFNVVLQRAYEPVVQAIAHDYDPLVSVTNAGWDPADNIGGLELVKLWREGVWRNAERLLNASTPSEYHRVAETIEANAAAWARAIAAPQTPGYRAYRDAYCASR